MLTLLSSTRTFWTLSQVERVCGQLRQLKLNQTSSSFLLPSRDFSNAHRAAITRTNRLQYLLSYPTVVVNPDGSTFTIRHSTPRKIIKLPVDVSLLSEAARNARLERRKLKTKVKLDEDFEEEGFDAKKYLKFVKQ